jgi:hypothetical protein
MKLSKLVYVVAAALALLSAPGCKTAKEKAEEVERDKNIHTRFDALEKELGDLQERLGGINQDPSAPSMTLRPVVPVEPAPPATMSEKERLETLSQRHNLKPVVGSHAGKSAKSGKGGVDPKNNIRVPVPAIEVQRALKRAGTNPGTIDGKVGARTVAAIKAFQAKEGLKPDGIVGQATWARLQTYLDIEK